jgi:hypothetical protein
MSMTKTERKRRDGLVAAAAADGRILDSPENRAKWRALLDTPGGEKVLASLTSVSGPAVSSQEGPVFGRGGLGSLWGMTEDDDRRANAAETVQQGATRFTREDLDPSETGTAWLTGMGR